jgi:hypothetical protein
MDSMTIDTTPAPDMQATVANTLVSGQLSRAEIEELRLKKQQISADAQQALRERLAALAREVDALPPAPANNLQDDEILGYDQHGSW